jgi:carboxyl-terminal processing protease
MIKISFRGFRRILLIGVSLLVIFSGGYFLGVEGYKAKVDQAKNIKIVREIPPDKSNIDFSLFWKVWDTLQLKYFDKSKINNRSMVYGAISGMVAAIGDPYTVFLAPNDNKVVNEDLSGSFEGVGIQIGFRGNQLAVVAPLTGSPAEKAGIKPGDFIVGIKDPGSGIDRGTVGISLPEAVKLIRGKAGTKVTLVLTREGVASPLIVEVERVKLNVPSVILTYVGQGKQSLAGDAGKNIAHLQLLKFGAETGSEWDQKVSEIEGNGQIKGLILDVRNNPGGYLEGAVDVAGEFIKTGSVAVIEERSDGTKNEYKTQRIGRLTQIPMVVLVNGGSASAAEILAGALRDNKRAKIVGEKTFGKGSIQEPLDLDGGSGIHITVARWLTPAGIWVDEKGLMPDVEIKFDVNSKIDNQLEEAIKLLS